MLKPKSHTFYRIFVFQGWLIGFSQQVENGMENLYLKISEIYSEIELVPDLFPI